MARTKVTIELPDSLVKRLMRRAARDGQSLEHTVADLLLKGLTVDTAQDGVARNSTIVVHDVTRLPLIKCKHVAIPADAVAPERLADILLSQEVIWQQDAGG